MSNVSMINTPIQTDKRAGNGPTDLADMIVPQPDEYRLHLELERLQIRGAERRAELALYDIGISKASIPARLVEFRKNRKEREDKRAKVLKPKRKQHHRTKRSKYLKGKKRVHLRLKQNPKTKYREWKRKLLAKQRSLIRLEPDPLKHEAIRAKHDVTFGEDEFLDLVGTRVSGYRLTRIDKDKAWVRGNVFLNET